MNNILFGWNLRSTQTHQWNQDIIRDSSLFRDIRVAESVEGGPVDASELSINGTIIIDADGNWVGPELKVQAMGQVVQRLEVQQLEVHRPEVQLGLFTGLTYWVDHWVLMMVMTT